MKTSYLNVPRIHFKGRFRADVNSRNNCQCNFDINNPLNKGQEWNYKGTCEFEFIDTYITSVIDKDGKEDSVNPLLHGRIFSNDEGPLAKVVDLDVDWQVSSLYGLNFGIEVDGEVIIRGDCSLSIIVRDMWNRLKCGKIRMRDSVYGTISTSIITNIKWLSEKTKALQDATKCEECTGDLAVSISLSYYSGDVFTIGNVIGTIGVAKKGEPLNAGGDRKLETTNPQIQICPDGGEAKNVTNVAPFIFDEDRNTLVLDISNAFPMDANNMSLDLGELWLGALVEESWLGMFSNEVINIFGEPLPYMDEKTWERGGVVEYSVPSELIATIKSSLLVIIKEVHSDYSGEQIYPLREILPSLQSGSNKGLILLKELSYFIRPTGYYHDRLEYLNANRDMSQMTLLVTSFGKPVDGATVNVEKAPPSVIPEDGIVVEKNSKMTNIHGLVTFTFRANSIIPYRRKYRGINPCDPIDCPPSKKDRIEYLEGESALSNDLIELPIDGQVYKFRYFMANGKTSGCQNEINYITIVSFSTMNYSQPYTWVDHVGPIFKQVHHLYYVMTSILNLTSYEEMTKPYNIKLLLMAFKQDINNPNYMPVTRDLSPTKVNMILEWLDNPCLSKMECTGSSTTCPYPYTDKRIMPESDYERCNESIIIITGESNPHQYFEEIYNDDEYPTFSLRAENPPRPLFGYLSEKVHEEANESKAIPLLPSCSKESLQQQLQLAVEVEFTTIPLYATSLYTIIDNCNVEAQNMIRNILVQEMLHFAQAANLLIAIGGHVMIDSNNTVPYYPLHPLPGGILPNLTLTLEKYTMKHVYENFMALEVPTKTNIPKPHEQWNTIGQFYKEIENCIKTLGEDLFEGVDENLQVEWPWETTATIGTLYRVSDLESAISGLEQITEQGEGASDNDPVDESTKQYAHFFRYEEIFCENELQKIPNGTGYAYTGPLIPYYPKGVVNMKDSLKVADIRIGTKCYTEARAFHKVYRSFLRLLQKTFNGHPREIMKAVKLMESLKVHAKRTLWTPLDDASQEPQDEQIMCGPIWDYDWE